MAVAFSEKINVALKNNNPNEAKRLLNIYSKYMNDMYTGYKQRVKSRRFYEKSDIQLDAVARKGGYPYMLSGQQLNQLFNMFPQNSAEYATVQKLVKMQDEVSREYTGDLHFQDAMRKYNSVYLYPNDDNYGVLPEHYKQVGIKSDKAYIDKLKADEARGANAIIASATSPLGGLGSATRVVGVSDETADNLAIGGALAGSLLSAGSTLKTGTGMKGSVLDVNKGTSSVPKTTYEAANIAGKPGTLTGRVTKIPNKADAETRRSLQRENESAVILVNKGYNVQQNPQKLPNGKEPDYRINSEVWDNYAPKSSNIRNIHGEVAKKIKKGQTNNVVINLKDTNASVEAVKKQFLDWPVNGLKQIIIIDKSNRVVKVKLVE